MAPSPDSKGTPTSVPEVVSPFRGGFVQRMFGTNPKLAWALLLPVGFSVAVDLVARPPLFLTTRYFDGYTYARGVLVGLFLSIIVLWILARPRTTPLIAAFQYFVIWGMVFPFDYLAYVCQMRYFANTANFFQVNTLAIAIQQWDFLRDAFKATLAFWLLGLLPAAAMAYAVGRLGAWLRPSLGASQLHLPIVAVAFLTVTFVRARELNGGAGLLPPDASAFQALGGLMRSPVGFTARTPLETPPLQRTQERAVDTVILVVTESIRADAWPSPQSPMDTVAIDRIPLTHLRSQASSTMISCISTWTGLSPNIDCATAIQAPLVFEIAKKSGFRTAYIASQFGNFQGLSAFLHNGGIDELVLAEDLDPNALPAMGTNDRFAAERAIKSLAEHPEPTFLVLHFSSTHYPYLVDDNLAPKQPMSDEPKKSQVRALRNRYENAIWLQEHTFATFLSDLQKMPRFGKTAVLFTSDHGEQFFEHHAFSHIRSLYEEEIRVPGFLLLGPNSVTPRERECANEGSRRYLYNQDLFATVVDLLGVWDGRAQIPMSNVRRGRSLLRPLPIEEPMVVLANQNGISEYDEFSSGVVKGAFKLHGHPAEGLRCFQTEEDPAEQRPLPAAACPQELRDLARAEFPKWSQP